MAIRERLSGNEAAAVAMKQINPDVVAAFPITPSTEIPQYFSQFVADGAVDTEFVAVESEHSAMSACIGAAAAGARAMTATSANGLALMWEMLYIAASCKLPIVMSVVNRALSGPINIHNDHSDSMGARDSGWIQLYSETNQEAYDNLLMANRIAEHPDVLLPLMVCQDGFITSHAIESIELLEDDKAKGFVGTYKPPFSLLDRDNPVAVGPLDMHQYYFEHKMHQAQSMRNAKKVILEVSDEFAKLTGRKYGLFEEYKTEDADVALVLLNSTAGTAKYVVDELRKQGKKSGYKPRVYRPFPVDEIAALAGFKAVASWTRPKALTRQADRCLPMLPAPCMRREYSTQSHKLHLWPWRKDVKTDDIEKVISHLFDIAEKDRIDSVYNYVGVRE